jgi:hypothetical protein
MSIFLGAVNATNRPLKALSAKNQKNVDKAVYYDALYDNLNDERDRADNDGNERLKRQLDRKCEVAFDKYLDYLNALPMGERNRVEKYTFNKFNK